MTDGDRWRGIQRHGAGYRAEVSQGRDRPKLRQHFPAGTDPKAMQAWRADQRAAQRLDRKPRSYKGTFTYDAARYLKAVTALPTYRDRVREIGAWTAEFGRRRRDTIESVEIRAIRDRWLTQPRSPGQPPLSAGTVNKRLRALSNLYRVLDGRLAQNPVRDVPEAPEPAPEPRALDYDTIARLLAALPDLSRPQKSKPRGTRSKTKIRLTCLAYCPITPKQLGLVRPADVDLQQGRVRLPARKKGKGAPARWLPLVPQALDAFRVFHDANCYGPFSVQSAAKSFRRAARQIGLTGARVYDLRHSFGTLAYRATANLQAVADMLQHGSIKTTQRYALAAEQLVMAKHMGRVGRQFGPTGQRHPASFRDIPRPNDEPVSARPSPSDKRTRAKTSMNMGLKVNGR